MKKILLHIIILIGIIILYPNVSFSSDSLKTETKSNSIHLIKKSKPYRHGYRLQMSNHRIDSTYKISKNNYTRMKDNCDVFIDKDGDGINDNRCNVTGLGKRQMKGFNYKNKSVSKMLTEKKK